jgi:hypothetical protein
MKSLFVLPWQSARLKLLFASFVLALFVSSHASADRYSGKHRNRDAVIAAIGLAALAYSVRDDHYDNRRYGYGYRNYDYRHRDYRHYDYRHRDYRHHDYGHHDYRHHNYGYQQRYRYRDHRHHDRRHYRSRRWHD